MLGAGKEPADQMSLNITSGAVFKPQKVVLYGPEGIGKSTFASHFPQPLFIDTEGGTALMDVRRLPKPMSWETLKTMITEVANTPDCCKTLVIDTLDWAEQLCAKCVCNAHGKTGIEDFGYGKGYTYEQEEFVHLLNGLSAVIESGKNVVLTAHAKMRKFEQPDETGAYDRYELKLGGKAGSQVSALVKEWADMLLFANYKQIVTEVNGKNKVQGGKRVMYTQHHPCWDAKNRHDLPEELPFDYVQIAHCIPGDETVQAVARQIPGGEAALEKTAQKPAEAPKKDEPKQVDASKPKKATAAKPSPSKTKSEPKIDARLKKLMERDRITGEDLAKFAKDKGIFSKLIMPEDMDQDFIDEVLIKQWGKVVENIRLPF